jgi:hypothetical protein
LLRWPTPTIFRNATLPSSISSLVLAGQLRYTGGEGDGGGEGKRRKDGRERGKEGQEQCQKRGKEGGRIEERERTKDLPYPVFFFFWPTLNFYLFPDVRISGFPDFRISGDHSYPN